MTREQDESRVRLSREVRIGELILALSTISAVAAGYIELRMRPLEQQNASIESQIQRLDVSASAKNREIREDLLRLEGKLDHLLEIERRQGGR